MSAPWLWLSRLEPRIFVANEWFRAFRPQVYVGILRDDPPAGSPTAGLRGLDAILSAAGVLSRLGPLLDAHTVREPLHVTLRDLGYADPKTTPRILILETIATQIDAGLNEIPQGTCAIAIGRAAHSPDPQTPSLTAGASDLQATSIIHILERYLTQYIPAKIFLDVQSTDGAGVGDLGDNRNWPSETMVLLDGFTTGPTRRGSAETAQFILHITHFLGGLTFSSSLSGQSAAGAANPVMFQPGLFPSLLSGFGLPMTVFGAAASCMAGGNQIFTDFWGYQVPGNTKTPPSLCTKGFLDSLAANDIFNWDVFRTADFGGTFCGLEQAAALRNNQARSALSRIEPLWPDWGDLAPDLDATAAAGAVWDSLGTAIRDAHAAKTSAVDRFDLIGRAGNAFNLSGYKYGVPIGLYTINAQPVGLVNEPGRGFASDIVGATLGDLAPASFWELIAMRYSSRYQVALAPMADRAVLVPATPVLNGYWQFVYASEIYSWDDDVQTPVPIRGVTLSSDRLNATGVLSGPGMINANAGFDSCQPGVFVAKEMPSWLMTYYAAPAITGNATVQGAKSAAGAPWTTGPAALAAIGGVAVAGKIGVVTPETQSTGNRLAQALWQQERLRYRSIYITGRLRVDIAPGSLLTVELPADRFVRQALGNDRDVIMKGMVLRMTHQIDAEAKVAQTSFQLGFARFQGETISGQPLYGEIHPFWATACLGLPWCDSVFLRDLLGDRASIVDELAGP